jgi:hypothetical protein
MPRPNRRLGDRKPVEPTQIQWNVPVSGWRQRFKKQTPHMAVIQDVSVTGAAVVAPKDPNITRGTLVPVSFGWIEGRVRVKRIDAHLDGANSIYGVEFEHTESPLAQAIHKVFLDRKVGPGDDAQPEGPGATL